MKIRFSLLASMAFALLAGCARDGGSNAGPETDDPIYKRAKSEESQGHPQEALADYLKLIDERGNAAPESHLDAGLIYLKELHMPIKALENFDKYLELRPNSVNADLVRLRIDEATRMFVATTPGGRGENQLQQLDSRDEIARLQKQVEELTAENATLKAGFRPQASLLTISTGAPQPAGLPQSDPATMTISPARPPPGASSAPAPQLPSGGRSGLPTGSGTASKSGASSAKAGTPTTKGGTSTTKSAPSGRAGVTAAGGRTHTVEPKQSLYQIAIKYYGSGATANIEKIKAANGLTSDSLTVGQVLRIP